MCGEVSKNAAGKLQGHNLRRYDAPDDSMRGEELAFSNQCLDLAVLSLNIARTGVLTRRGLRGLLAAASGRAGLTVDLLTDPLHGLLKLTHAALHRSNILSRDGITNRFDLLLDLAAQANR